MDNILDEIRKERERQDKKWGVQNHSPIVWDSILGEEAGEVSKSALESFFNHMGDNRLEDYRKELIQTAAVAVAAVECLDRNQWDWSTVKKTQGDWNKIDYSDPDGYPDSETGELFEILTSDGSAYLVYFMDYGVILYNSGEEIEKEIVFWRKYK